MQRTMVRLSYVVLIIAMNALVCVVAEEGTPEDIMFDVQPLLRNYRLREHFFNCFRELIPCGLQPMENLKKFVDNAIQTDCKQCTEKQKERVKLLSDWYMKYEPKKWQYIFQKSKRRQMSNF